MDTEFEGDDRLLDRIDRCCCQFEEDWRAGRRSAIESYLETASDDERDHLLRELLSVEIELLVETGSEVDYHAYRRRFPEQASFLDRLDTEHGSSLPETQFAPGGPPSSWSWRLGSRSEASSASNDGFGVYQILEEIGRGGMGVVYRAKHTPTERIVALKIIRNDRISDIDSDFREQLIARFYAEAGAAARLDHDHAVTVYDVGCIEGVHFISMQYVPGRSLYEMIEQTDTSQKGWAQYMAGVASAIHAAHCQGILHRDIKPGNILVDSREDRAMITDFGLAKLQNANVALTQDGTVFGSPPYMAPEQITNVSSVTASADVYSLGATLYHVITGSPPFDPVSRAAVLNQVLTEMPLPPRSRKATIDRDLETICLKCLEKGPNDRYSSARRLAEDLSRYVRGEVILARPIGPVRRFWRVCLQHQVISSIIVTALTLLAIAAMVTTDRYWNERRHRQIAEQSLRLARQAIDHSVVKSTSSPFLRARGLEQYRLDQLYKAREFYDQLLAMTPNDLGVQEALATTYHQLGQLHGAVGRTSDAEQDHAKALRIRQTLVETNPESRDYRAKVADSHHALGNLYCESVSYDASLAEFSRAIEIRSSLQNEVAMAESRTHLMWSNAESLLGRGKTLEAIGSTDEALRDIRGAVAILEEVTGYKGPEDPLSDLMAADQELRIEYFGALANAYDRLGSAEMAQGQLTDAESHYGNALHIANQLRRRAAHEPEYQEYVAIAHAGLAEIRQQIDQYEKKRGIAHAGLAEVRQQIDQSEKARESLVQACDVYRSLSADHPAVTNYRLNLARCYMNLADIEGVLGRPEEKENLLEQAAGIYSELVRDHADIHGFRYRLADCWLNLAIHLLESQDPAHAEQILRECLAKIRDTGPQQPIAKEHRVTHSTVLHYLGRTLARLSRMDEAIEAFEAALEALGDPSDLDPAGRHLLASTELQLGFACEVAGETARARYWMDKAATRLADLAQHDAPENDRRVWDAAFAHFHLSMLQADSQEIGEAVASAERAISILAPSGDLLSATGERLALLAKIVDHKAFLPNEKASTDDLRSAIDLWELAYRADEDPLHLVRAARCCRALSCVLETDEPEAALEVVGREIDWLRQLTERPDGIRFQRLLADAQVRRATLLLAQGKPDKATEDYRAARRFAETASDAGLLLPIIATSFSTGRYEFGLDGLKAVLAMKEVGANASKEIACIMDNARTCIQADETLTPNARRLLLDQIDEVANSHKPPPVPATDTSKTP